MKINPINLIYKENPKLEKTFYFISGNESTLMQKINDIIILYFKENLNYKIENIKKLENSSAEVELFNSGKIYIVSDISDLEKTKLDTLSKKDDVFIFKFENSPKNNLIKKKFASRDDSYLIDCYKLTKEEKIKVTKLILEKSKIKLDDIVFWYLIDNLDNKYFFLEKEIEKITNLNTKSLNKDSVYKIISKNSSESDKVFFEIFKSNESLVNIYNDKITTQSDVNDFYNTFRQFCLIIINSKDENAFINSIPKYLFRERQVFLDIYKKYNEKKKIILLDLLFKTEKKLRKQSGLSLMLGLRFLLTFKRITIS